MTQYELSIDPVHSAIEFAVTYAMNSVIKGRFLEYSGVISLDTDDPFRNSVQARINASSLTTDGQERDQQLKGSEFFDVSSSEWLTFDSSSVEIVEDRRWHLSGDLTMAGHSHPVTLDIRYYGIQTDSDGGIRAGFVAESDINRSDWGMNWNAQLDNGVLISDRVRISLYISAIPAGLLTPDQLPSHSETVEQTEEE